MKEQLTTFVSITNCITKKDDGKMRKQMVTSKKRNGLLILICILLFCLGGVACSQKKDNVGSDSQKELGQDTVKDQKTEEVLKQDLEQGTKENSDDLKEETPVISSLLTYQYVPTREAVPYEPIQVTPKVINSQVNADFSNVFNYQLFSGFTKDQLDMLHTNGFVVLEPNANYPYLKMHTVNEMAEYSNISQFITTDSVLHMFRVFYSESLKALELLEYLPRIEELSLSMYQKSYDYYQKADLITKADLLKTTAYLGVATKLLCGVDSIKTDSDLDAIIDVELSRIEKASGLEKSMIFGKNVDYSQYVVRGHYTLHEDLGRFFKGMMWYGQTGFQLSRVFEKEEVVDMDQVIPSLMIALMTFEDQGIEAWTQIYDMTNLYSGFADDLLVLDLQKLLVDVFGKVPTMEELRNPDYEAAITQGVKELRSPAIIPEVTNKDIDMPAGKQFRFMGQRYTLDADILQKLMEPVLRPVPTEFDVLSAMNLPAAEEILYDYYPTNQEWPEYDVVLGKMKDQVANFQGWMDNIYHGMLWSIQSAGKSFENQSGLPHFMTTHAWSLKNLSSALGNLAELKHDNILYSKQPVAEMGGDFNQPYNYVEPNVEVYSKLIWVAKYTKANLEAGGIADSRIVEPLDEIIKLLGYLETAAIKELQGENLTQEEMSRIGTVGGLTDLLFYQYQYYLQQQGIQMYDQISSALIADVATILGPGGGILEVATGLPYEIYVLCETNGKIFIGRGAVYSYYEFLSEERLTDEKWQEMIGLSLKENEYGYEDVLITQPQVELLDMMPWMKDFISSEENNVMIDYAEIEW